MRNEHPLRIQKKIFSTIEEDLAVFRYKKSKELLNYEKEYAKEFKKRFSLASKYDLLKRLLKSQIIFCGDFHSLHQSQRTAIRLLRELILKKKIVLCLECIQHRYQPIVDAYYNRKITIMELREEIDFDNSWLFSWENYKELIEFAKNNEIPILALNTELHSAHHSLSDRDSFGAKVLTNFLLQNPNANLFVLYGDLHVARKHLPKATKEIMRSNGLSFKSTIIFQNEPKIYWELSRKGAAHKTDVVRIGQDTWCILNSTPWVRLQSFMDWLEQTQQNDKLTFFVSEDENITGKINTLLQHLQHFFLIEPSIDLDASIYTTENISSLKKIFLKKNKSPIFKKSIEYAKNFNRTILLAKTKALFIPQYNINILSEAASYYLRSVISPHDPLLFDPKSNMPQIILNSARIYLASKIINPKRKCEEIQDIYNFIEYAKTHKTENTTHKIKAFLWARKELEWIFSNNKTRIRAPKKMRWSFSIGQEAARLVGNIIGERIFYAYNEGEMSHSQIKDFFFTPIASPESSRDHLQKIAKVLRSSTYSVKSKFEKL